MRIGLVGACGRMGRAIVGLAAEEGSATVALEITGETDLSVIEPGMLDVLVDFSSPRALAALLSLGARLRVPILIGTTGLSPEDHAAIDRTAAVIPVLQTGNTSLGINLLRLLVGEAAARLGPDWDIEIVEAHHRAKLDTPSGTALMLGAAANRARGAADGRSLNRFDRMQASPHEREQGTIGYSSLRGGTVAGDHQVLFLGHGERVELGHRAENRLVFARGALTAAAWLIGKPSGRYTMADVLG